MRIILFVGPLLILPFIMVLFSCITKKKLITYYYILHYLALLGYYLFLIKINYQEFPPEPSTKFWHTLFTIIILLVIIFVLIPMSLFLQKAFFNCFNKKNTALSEHKKR